MGEKPEVKRVEEHAHYTEITKKRVKPASNQNAFAESVRALNELINSEGAKELTGKLMDNSKNKYTVEQIARYLLAGGSVVGGCILSYYGKLDPSISILLGSVIGYMFGKNAN